jgi:hypothetical protein
MNTCESLRRPWWSKVYIGVCCKLSTVHYSLHIDTTHFPQLTSLQITLTSTFPSTPTLKLPLPLAPTLARSLRALAPLLLHIEHQAENIETELRVLQAQPLKLLLGLVPEHMAASRPESGHGLPDRLVLDRSLLIHEARVRDLALGRGLCEVDFLVRDLRESREAEALGERVDACVAEERDAAVVGGRDGRVVFHCVAADGREVVALVDVLEHGGAGVDVIVGELDAAGGTRDEAVDFGLEVGCLHEEALVGGESGLQVAGADDEFYDRGAEVA